MITAEADVVYDRYWSRKFKQHMDRKRSARMTTIPQLNVPDILVEDEDYDRPNHASRFSAGRISSPGNKDWDWQGNDLEQRSAPMLMDISLSDAEYQHPLSFPRTTGNETTNAGITPAAFSFELYEPEMMQGETLGQMTDPYHAHTGSSPSRSILEDSVWADSIRRSTTLRRPERRSHFYDDNDHR